MDNGGNIEVCKGPTCTVKLFYLIFLLTSQNLSGNYHQGSTFVSQNGEKIQPSLAQSNTSLMFADLIIKIIKESSHYTEYLSSFQPKLDRSIKTQ